MRAGRRTLVESLYLLTAPVTALVGVLLVCVGGARWSAGLERWRIAKLRALTAGTGTPGQGSAAASSAPRVPSAPGPWLDAGHAVAVLPVVLVTSVVTALWWFVSAASLTSPLRARLDPGPQHPMTLAVGAHTSMSIQLGSPNLHAAFGLTLGLLVLLTLPLVTRVCVAAQAGLGRVLLWDESAVLGRIRGLEQERDTARAQTAAAVTAEAAALRRLERDLHDGPQQRLVRLAMELGRAQHNLDRRPAAVREALADAIVQTRETLDELRALSRGIAPPILVDRGLREALAALAFRSPVPAELDAPAGPDLRLDPAVETAAYFVVSEALTNVAKHSGAGRCVIGLRHEAGALRVWIRDDGAGGAALGKGHGLQGLEDRLHAVGGRLLITSPSGGPTTITGEVPCR
ncbi:putative sensor protein [Kitasatospora cineracea]|uniref:histidine kinase n=1 Tax=Kitasatospora cineracea TaxID=88074 RepID=A0A8G1XGN1_9ACTN|nr:putative sensor protein [Kitasatospora cineracea]